jgi:hypothetical protein
VPAFPEKGNLFKNNDSEFGEEYTKPKFPALKPNSHHSAHLQFLEEYRFVNKAAADSRCLPIARLSLVAIHLSVRLTWVTFLMDFLSLQAISSVFD